MTNFFHETIELDGSNYVKILLRSSTTLNIGNDDKCSFLWLILAKLQPCEKIHPNRVPE